MSEADVQAIRDLYAHDDAEWSPIRSEGTTDMQFAAGDPWDPKDRAAREKANRLCLSTDELSQYVNQVVNEVRSNKRAVKFTPVGNGATDQSAQFYANKMREIEYRSRAQIGYTTAFENCVQRSFGFVRVNKRYQHARAVHQDLWIDPVHNPNLITPDCEALMPDLSDMTHCWVREQWAYDDFNKKWSKYKLNKPTAEDRKAAGSWLTDTGVFVGEYWKIETTTRTLLIVQAPDGSDPIGIFEDELKGRPLPGQLLDERKVDDPKVVQQITNGLDILEENEWEGKYIPIVGCLGKVLYVTESGSQRRQILSMIRLARNPQMMLAYLNTAEMETVGQMTKFPYFAYEGQLSQQALDDIARSNHEPVAAIQVKPTVEGVSPGTLLPLPQRNPWSLELSSYEMVKEATRRSIQAAMGQTPLPTAAQRRNEKSGVALKHIDELGQKGSFHFTDHYLDMITQVGVIIEDLMDKAGYDATRSTGIRKDDDTAEIIRINDPNDPKSVSTKGDHLVTVSTGPSFDSERDAANEFAGDIINSPQVLQLMGPQKAPQLFAKAVKLKNLGPIGDQIAEIIDPQPGKDGKPTPEQMEQKLQEVSGQAQQMSQMLQEAKSIIDGKKIEQQTEIQKAEIGKSEAIAVQHVRNQGAIAVAHIAAASKGLALNAHAAEEAEAMGHEASMSAAEFGHDVGMSAMEHQQQMAANQQAQDHALEQGDQAHGQALEQGAMGHQQALEQQAAAPQPETGA